MTFSVIILAKSDCWNKLNGFVQLEKKLLLSCIAKKKLVKSLSGKTADRRVAESMQ